MNQTPYPFPADYPSDIEFLLRAKRAFDQGDRLHICSHLRQAELEELLPRFVSCPELLPREEQRRMYPYIELIRTALHGAITVESYLFPGRWPRAGRGPLTSSETQSCLEFREDLWKMLFDHAEAKE